LNVRLVGDAVMGGVAVMVKMTRMTSGLFDAWDDVSVILPLYVPAERPDGETNTETDPGVVPPHPFEVGFPLAITVSH
jgi:hypothetical protein